MAKSKGKSKTSSRSKASQRALNAFDLAEEEENVKTRGFVDQDGGDDGEDSNTEMMNGEVRSEDDEDIDSDEALGSDDDWEEMISRKKRPQNDDSDDDGDVGRYEDPDEYDNINSDELMTLSEIWDMDDKKTKKQASSDDDSGSEEEEVDNESEDELSEDSDADEVDESQMSKLRKGLGDESKPSKKRLEVSNVPENEYALPAAGKKVSLADLTGAVSDSKGLNLIKGKKGIENKSKKLAIPLPKRIQERHDRSAAYDLAKDEVDRWDDTVQSNRQAEHLQFPINPAPAVQKVTNYTPNEPSNEFEKKVSSVLNESALQDENALATFEDLAPAKVSKEEVERQLNERRLMRELALREEKKARRIKKIKSKSYRRVHKKEREKEAALADSESDEEDHNAKRAKERMTLKHKNNGKWARDMVNQGFTKDQETRAEMEQMLRRGHALRQKIQGQEDSDDSEAEDARDKELDNIDASKVGKGIFGMKFMQDAQAAERQRNEQMLLDDENIFEDDEQEPVNIGRRTFNPEANEARDDAEDAVQEAREDAQEEEEKSLTARLSKPAKVSVQEQPEEQEDGEEEEDDDDESNPWMTMESNKPLQKSKTIKDGDKRLTKKQKEKQKAQEQSEVIDMNQTLDLVDPLSEGKLMSFEQKDLVKRAFAGDDVVQEFQEAKRQKVEEEGDQELDMTLPGWGSWDGPGFESSSKAPKKKVVKKVRGVAQDKRKDAKLQNVIINEKINKKTSQFSANTVPYPFETREQYERSLRMPMGQEWASRDTHQRLTKPRVMVKQGVVIDPINAPFK